MELSWPSWWPRGPWKPILGQLDGESLDSFQGRGAVTTSSGCPPALDAAAGLPWGLSRGRGAILSWSLQLPVPQGQHLCLSAGLARWACVALDAGGSCSAAEPMSWGLKAPEPSWPCQAEADVVKAGAKGQPGAPSPPHLSWGRSVCGHLHSQPSRSHTSCSALETCPVEPSLSWAPGCWAPGPHVWQAQLSH